MKYVSTPTLLVNSLAFGLLMTAAPDLAAQSQSRPAAKANIPYSDAKPILQVLRENLLPAELRSKSPADLEALWPDWVAQRDATIRAMEQVSGPVIAVGLVLSAVFIPCAFISGIMGQFFRQFALTISVSTVISAFNSLTLSPALTALLLRPRDKHTAPPLPWPSRPATVRRSTPEARSSVAL